MSSGSFKNVTYRLFVCKSYIFDLFNMHEQDLALNYLQGFICDKTQPTNNYPVVPEGIVIKSNKIKMKGNVPKN